MNKEALRKVCLYDKVIRRCKTNCVLMLDSQGIIDTVFTLLLLFLLFKNELWGSVNIIGM